LNVNAEQINAILNTVPIASWAYPRILVGILKERAISHADAVLDNLFLIAAQGPAMVQHPYGRTDVVRNHMAASLLGSDYTHLLMLDIDHQHPIDIVQRLALRILHDPKKLVVGGLNFRRSTPHEPCCFLDGEDGAIYAPAAWDEGAVLEVDYIGTGSILIAREVFERIEPPWFYNLYDRAWRDEWPGEDMGFSIECKKAGIKLWVDTTVTSPHATDRMIDESSFRGYIATHPDYKVMENNQ
jgi:hypothetical protein